MLARVLGLTTEFASPLHQILIYNITIVLQLRQFWDIIRGEIAHKYFYTTSITAMRMRLPQLQDDDKKTRKPRAKRLSKDWENIEEIFYY